MGARAERRRRWAHGVAGAIVAAALVGCGDQIATSGTDDGPVTTETSAVALRAERDPATLTTLPETVVDLAQGELQPGAGYLTRNFAIPISFESPDLLFGLDSPAFVGLAADPNNPVESSYLVAMHVPGIRGIKDPLSPSDQLLDAGNAVDAETAPIDDVEAWLRSVSHLQVGDAEHLTVDGQPATLYPYRIGDLPEDSACPPPSGCLALLYVPSISLWHGLPENSVGTFTVVDGGRLLLQSSARAEAAETWEASATAWRDSIQFS